MSDATYSAVSITMPVSTPKGMLKLFMAARNVSVPILGIRTGDQQATIAAITKTTDAYALVQWDAVRGITGVNKVGTETLKKCNISGENTIGFVEAMIAIERLPQGTIVFARNAYRQIMGMDPQPTAAAVQAVANLRDLLKTNFRMLILLGPYFALPPELDQDVVLVDHELPGPEELTVIMRDIFTAARQSSKAIAHPTEEVLAKAVTAVSGLSSFNAEQVAAMSFTDVGLDQDALWERKRVAIEQTPGLSVWRGRETFADLVGLDAIKVHLRRRIHSKRPIGVVVWIDEIDKALANVENDTSGVRMYQLLKLLVEMENNEWPGLIGVGVAGGGKSLIAKAFGNEAGVITIALDLGATESKYVGESEANLLRALAIVKAVGRGHAYFIATSNAASVMRPELQRRFTDGMWMFDLMTPAERAAAWTFYLHRYGIQQQALPEDSEWTGAEIRNCSRYAYDTDCTLVEAAQFIVPMARSRADDIERLRRFAHGRFLDASKSGPYQYKSEPMERAIRAIAVPGAVIDRLAEMKES